MIAYLLFTVIFFHVDRKPAIIELCRNSGDVRAPRHLCLSFASSEISLRLIPVWVNADHAKTRVEVLAVVLREDSEEIMIHCGQSKGLRKPLLAFSEQAGLPLEIDELRHIRISE